VIDRNLIVVILYNNACNYQGLWQLEKCSLFAEATLFNCFKGIKEDEATLSASQQSLEPAEEIHLVQAKLLKKYTFVTKVLLQFCAVLSQLSKFFQHLPCCKELHF
jgi:hypothetical protein